VVQERELEQELEREREREWEQEQEREREQELEREQEREREQELEQELERELEREREREWEQELEQELERELAVVLSKPESRKTTKARRRRQEAAVIACERAKCVARDGYCRLLGTTLFGACRGPSEWAHWGDWKRWKTRGMDPEERHRSDRSIMLCDRHHDMYDAHALAIEALTERGTDGRLRFTSDAGTYEEAA
jgi:flagellar biosynthesis GTPase FlhF